MFKEILEYQEKEKELIQIEKELTSSEERKIVGRAKKFITDVDAKVITMEDSAQSLKAKYEKLVSSKNEVEAELSEYADSLQHTDGEDEINYFIKKINELEGSAESLNNEMTNVINEIKVLLTGFDDYRKKVKKAKEEYEEYKVKYEALKAEKQPAMDLVNKELLAISKKVPADIMEKYKAVRARKVYPVVVPINNENCGGCSMELSMNKMSELNDKKIIECEECGRLIYKI